jgi:hypothetical protein
LRVKAGTENHVNLQLPSPAKPVSVFRPFFQPICAREKSGKAEPDYVMGWLAKVVAPANNGGSIGSDQDISKKKLKYAKNYQGKKVNFMLEWLNQGFVI